MDILIRFAKVEDKNALAYIWKKCFGDPEIYINFFMEHCFRPENTIVATFHNKVVGVIYMLPAQLANMKFMYGYAIGVLPEFRGKNICEQMHIFLKKYAMQENFLYGLHPANETLSQYYQRIGLKEMFSLRLYSENHFIHNDICIIGNVTPEEYLNIRNTHFSPLVSWNADLLSYILGEANQFGGFFKKIILPDHERIIFGKKSKETLYIKETTMSDTEILRFSNCLKRTFSANRICYVLPNSSELGERKSTILGFGEINDKVYMNLFLD